MTKLDAVKSYNDATDKNSLNAIKKFKEAVKLASFTQMCSDDLTSSAVELINAEILNLKVSTDGVQYINGDVYLYKDGVFITRAMCVDGVYADFEQIYNNLEHVLETYTFKYNELRNNILETLNYKGDM